MSKFHISMMEQMIVRCDSQVNQISITPFFPPNSWNNDNQIYLRSQPVYSDNDEQPSRARDRLQEMRRNVGGFVLALHWCLNRKDDNENWAHIIINKDSHIHMERNGLAQFSISVIIAKSNKNPTHNAHKHNDVCVCFNVLNIIWF